MSHSSNLTSSLPTRASLLGLPTELRHLIYQHVFLLPINHLILTSWSDVHSAEHGFREVPDLNRSVPLQIPWLNLSLTCRTLAQEIRSAMREARYASDERLHTYVLHLEGRRGGVWLGATTWVALPCPPEEVRVLEVSYDANSGFQAWGSGGPHGITSGLYQTLNHLTHCGPRLDSRFELARPMHIRELRIVVERREGKGEERSRGEVQVDERETDPETMLYALGSIVGRIVNTGVLKGFVDRIRMRESGGQTLQWDPEGIDGEGIPDYWNRSVEVALLCRV
jgi:hypothetical protein